MNSRRTPSIASSSPRNSPHVPRQQVASQLGRQRPPSTRGIAPTPTPPIVEPSPASGLDRPAMSSASLYISNLKVLRRRDPSIISIFDQFSHVCVYHHNGDKWEKQGYEGSMFLYERDSYPPYGFYILNRMGMSDYIQRLYPEDNWTARRLENVLQTSLAEGRPIPDKFSPEWDIGVSEEELKQMDKGQGFTVGLWIFAHDSADSMMDVMTRLYSYIKQNLPYPEEFKYGPDRPPRLNMIHRMASVPPASESDAHIESIDRAIHSASTKPATPVQSLFKGLMNGSTSKPADTSELDKLFAKLNPPPPSVPPTAQTLTVDSLFASLGGTTKAKSPPPTSSTSSASTTGLALLDSIFASATPTSQQSTISTSTSTTASAPLSQSSSVSSSLTATLGSQSYRSGSRATQNPPNPEPEPIIIYSPTPTTSALPQILNQDVISTLLGLPSSRASSAAPTTTSSSTRTSDSSSTRRSGREGGDEDDGDYSSDGGHSESSTVLDRLLVGSREVVNGDVTPRVPTNGYGYDRPSSSSRLQNFVYPNKKSAPPTAPTAAVPPAAPHPSHNGQHEAIVNGHHTQASRSGGELWENTSNDRFVVDGGDDDEILELDFADTRALSDMNVYKKTLARHDNSSKAAPTNGRLSSSTTGNKPPALHSRDGSSSDANVRSSATNNKDKKDRRKKNGKDRSPEVDKTVVGADRNVYNVPEAVPNSLQRQPHLRAVAAMSTPSPIAALPPTSLSDPAILLSSLKAPPQAPSKTVAVAAPVNGYTKNDILPAAPRSTSDIARESILATAASKIGKQTKLERNDFVREVLTLIHTDKSFVDSLYQDYLARS
ncbi:hypothetical protein ONZ45_g6555 [Pleurotus djamor]|nr:hypothetical protein ONZ45_g6555 [Pleurotus djamor]